ncbi:MAG: LLM class flavin-dependent oxidoreductase [Chloroflexi bacterium]|nr:LLM class flavin-dependent oxidoreductase [Chloroflexota bacterium]MBV9896459.1 LLM class flavin-dependent oxidoreductase [Chloroflexota bacterium]
MKASYFASLPYGRVSEPVSRWPVPNRLFDPDRAVRVAASRMEHVALADELGFDWVGCAEHHYSPGSLASNVSAVAAAITQRTKRARVCIMGALLPLNNPVRVAEEYALVDTLSGGRLVAGLLRGAPYEYLVYNVPPAESRARFEEAWELVVRAWSDTEPFGWEGDHYHFRNVSIWPRPIQQPLPPIFISGSRKESAEFAARKRIGLGLAFTNLAAAKPAAQHYFLQATEHGWTPSADQVIYGHLPVYLADTDEEAFAIARPRVEATHLAPGMLKANRLVAESGFFGPRNPELLRRFQTMGSGGPLSLEQQVELGTVLCGGAATVLKQLTHIRKELGAGVISLNFEIGDDDETTQATMRRFARDVLPAMHEL